MYLKLLLLSAGLIMVAVAGLGIRMLLIRGAKFPETHIGRNKNMRKMGISCAQNIDVGCNPSDDFPGCSTCKVVKH
ncbi:MAG: hypothetical protein E4G95_04605 [Bacteroidia bacterium]|nr:MAG: hypothetical protein E4G95_04605 [Bacteroidia bacterium]